MFAFHPARKFVWPFTTRFGSWHARQSWEFELSRTRKRGKTLSIFWKCGSWQVVHSIVPLIRRTFGSAVLPGLPNSCTFTLGVSTSGVCRLKGCELFRSVPNTEVDFLLPVMGIRPKTTVCPGATVPSWQLRQSLLGLLSPGCTPV